MLSRPLLANRMRSVKKKRNQLMKPRVILYCLLGGLPMTIAALGDGHPAWFWLSGIVMAAAFAPVALFGPRTALGQFGVIAPVLAIITVLCTWSEAFIFAPQVRPNLAQELAGTAVMYLIVAIVLAVLAWGLRLPKLASGPIERRSFAGTLAVILVCGIAYLVFYAVFGGITYQFFTKAYYPEAAQVAGKLGFWFWAIQFGRGALMTLAVLPVIYTLRMSRWQTAIVIGTIIWVAGGLSPLLVPNAFLGTTQRMIHIVEILTQNFSLGIVAGLLLRPKPKAVPAALATAANF
jgi:hypothetical protein